MPRLVGTQVGLLPDGRPVYAPLVLVRIQHGSLTAEVNAVLDSGADRSMVPGRLAELIGFPFATLASGGQSIGASGAFETRIAPGRISFDGRVFADGFAVAAPDTLPVVLLGRNDFFRHHVIRFNWHRDPPTFDVDPVARK